MNNVEYRRSFFRAFSSSALLLYIIFLSLPSLHNLIHAVEEGESHAQLCSNDHDNECHLYIVHFNEDFKCAHEGHISELDENCELCATHSYTQSHFISSYYPIASPLDTKTKSDFTQKNYYKQSCFYKIARGPPVS